MTALGIFFALLTALLIVRLVYSKICLQNLDVQLFFSKKSAVEGDSLVLSTILTNDKWLPLPWVAVKFQISRFLRFSDIASAQISDDYYRNDLYNILMYQKITRRLEFECGKRGYYRLKNLDVTSWDILMDKKYVKKIPCNASLTVYPSTLQLPEINEIFTRINGNIQARRFIHPDPFTFRGIREYSYSDPIKAINFKASAKTQNLMVNLWDYSVSRNVVLLLNLQRQSLWHNEILDERAIKIVASLAERLLSTHIPVKFITNAAGIVTGKGVNLPECTTPQHIDNILEALAHINLDTTEIETTFTETLKSAFERHHTEPEYWIVSTYHGKDLENEYNRISNLGATTIWIIPHSQQVQVDESLQKLESVILVE
ncbi:MAG: DUF58 domain-containing protein [Firmicutes bacterium]|nr:DUF58 domain-containing protein [Bacillota bacterium]